MSITLFSKSKLSLRHHFLSFLFALLTVQTGWTAPSACLELFGSKNPRTAPEFLEDRDKPSETPIFDKLQRNPEAKIESDLFGKQLGDKYPVELTPRMQVFRDRTLGFLKNPFYREILTRSYEVYFRIRSYLTERALEKSNGTADYDIIIVGSGPQGMILLHKALSMYPDAKILLIDAGDTAAATFRYGKELFDINSSNRPSGKSYRPLPGEGNINELPGLPIQVSDLTAVKYPTANDLGTAVVAGLYAALREHPNVDVLFNAKATTINVDIETENGPATQVLVSKTDSSSKFILEGQRVAQVPGVGAPVILQALQEAIRRDPTLVEYNGAMLPKLMTGEDFYRAQALTNRPADQTADMTLAIVGNGDTSFTLIQNQIGYAAREGYFATSGQDGRFRKIYVLGLEQDTCEKLLAVLRSRYANIVSSVRSSSPNVAAQIEIIPRKLANVSRSGRSGGVSAGRLTLGLEGFEQGFNSVENVDHVILATGYRTNLREIVKIGSSGFRRNPITSDRQFFNEEFDFLESRTSTSSGQIVKVGRISRGNNGDKGTFAVFGPGADLFEKEESDKEKAPAKIVQNFVGLFVNAPRVVAGTEKWLDGLVPSAKSLKLEPIGIEEKFEKPVSYIISEIQETRIIPSQSLNLLQSIAQQVFSFSKAGPKDAIAFRIVTSAGGQLKVVSENGADLTDLLTGFAKTREFFSLSRELLKSKSHDLRITAAADTNGLFQPKTVRVALVAAKPELANPAPYKVVPNGKVNFRGLDPNAKGTGFQPVKNPDLELPPARLIKQDRPKEILAPTTVLNPNRIIEKLLDLNAAEVMGQNTQVPGRFVGSVELSGLTPTRVLTDSSLQSVEFLDTTSSGPEWKSLAFVSQSELLEGGLIKAGILIAPDKYLTVRQTGYRQGISSEYNLELFSIEAGLLRSLSSVRVGLQRSDKPFFRKVDDTVLFFADGDNIVTNGVLQIVNFDNNKIVLNTINASQITPISAKDGILEFASYDRSENRSFVRQVSIQDGSVDTGNPAVLANYSFDGNRIEILSGQLAIKTKGQRTQLVGTKQFTTRQIARLSKDLYLAVGSTEVPSNKFPSDKRAIFNRAIILKKEDDGKFKAVPVASFKDTDSSGINIDSLISYRDGVLIGRINSSDRTESVRLIDGYDTKVEAGDLVAIRFDAEENQLVVRRIYQTTSKLKLFSPVNVQLEVLSDGSIFYFQQFPGDIRFDEQVVLRP